MEREVRKETIEEIKNRLNKIYGKGTVITANDEPELIDVISTGSLLIDQATGVGGLPRGRVVEFIGPESSGKTTLAMQVIAQAQKKGLLTAYIDMEHAFSFSYAIALGINTDKMLFSQPEYGEQALNIARQCVETGNVGVIVIDSVAALTPKKELEGEVGETNIGKQAWMMSQALRILCPIVKKTNTLVIFINQIRIKVGVLYGSPEVGAGGEALKFYASMRVDMRKLQADKEKSGNKIKIKIVKNKVAPPLGDAAVFLHWGAGINKFDEIFDLALTNQIIKRSGSWYFYNELKLGQGEDSAKLVLMDNMEMFSRIEQEVLTIIKIHKNG